MARSPFQVLVIPFKRTEKGIRYCLFRHSKGCWQWIVGGSEDGETPPEAAKRRALKEADILENGLIALDSRFSVPVRAIGGFLWGPDTLVVPEYCFGVDAKYNGPLSDEDMELMWTDYATAYGLLIRNNNRTALWELDHRLNHPASERAAADDERLAAQMEFALTVDKVKNVMRRSYIADGSRRENDAEHSWHLALMALLLREYAVSSGVDVLRVISMVLVHDLVEIYAGDTFLYDTGAAAERKAESERAAADRLFPILPPDQATEFRALWEEFEEGWTFEARYARALDRLQPLMLNRSAGGRTWWENGVGYETVFRKNPPIIARGAPELERYVVDLLNDARERGLFEGGDSEE